MSVEGTVLKSEEGTKPGVASSQPTPTSTPATPSLDTTSIPAVITPTPVFTSPPLSTEIHPKPVAERQPAESTRTRKSHFDEAPITTPYYPTAQSLSHKQSSGSGSRSGSRYHRRRSHSYRSSSRSSSRSYSQSRSRSRSGSHSHSRSGYYRDVCIGVIDRNSTQGIGAIEIGVVMALLATHMKGDIRMDTAILAISIVPIGVMIDMAEVNQGVIIMIINAVCLMN